MKKIYLLFAVGFIMCGCSDFLTQKSQDQIIPTKIEDIEQLIFGELIPRRTGINIVWDAMSDDVTSVWTPGRTNDDSKRETLYQYFTWQKDIEYDFKKEFKAEAFYSILYADIVLCNSLEDIIPDMIGTEQQRQRAMAEVYMFRAWAYFDLASIYGEPYLDEAASRTTPCVPMNDTKGLGMQIFPRSTQRAVFDQIEQDIERSIELFQKFGDGNSIYRPGLEAACILATRIFLTEKKYDKVIAYADMVAPESSLYNMKSFVEKHGVVEDMNSQDYNSVSHVHFFNDQNPEIVFTYQDNYGVSQLSPLGTSICGKYFPSDALRGVYDNPDDLRAKVYIDTKGNISKMAQTVRTVQTSNLRVTEALLNRAEAYAHTDPAKAKSDIEILRNARYNSAVDNVTGDMVEVVKDERRRELCFEGVRWLDLRRYGMPKITHDYFLKDNTTKEVYTLEQGDAGYTFNLPASVLDLNAIIGKHVRPERVPVVSNK